MIIVAWLHTSIFTWIHGRARVIGEHELCIRPRCIQLAVEAAHWRSQRRNMARQYPVVRCNGFCVTV